MEDLICDDYDRSPQGRHPDDPPYKDTRAKEALILLLVLLVLGLGLYFAPLPTVCVVVGAAAAYWHSHRKAT
jgi:hypothetical protein